jgi:hypothetical protein
MLLDVPSDVVIGLCERCWMLDESVVLTEVEGTINNPKGTSLVLLCEKCKK